MSNSVLIAGMRYHVHGEDVYRKMAEHPESFTLIAQKTRPYGEVVHCYHDGLLVGRVCRMDVQDVLSYMKGEKLDQVTGHMKSMNRQCGYLLLELEGFDRHDSLEMKLDVSKWRDWYWEGPEMEYPDDMRESKAMLTMTAHYLEQPATEEIVELLNVLISKLIRLSKYQLDIETQQRMNELRTPLSEYPDQRVSSRIDDLLQAIQHMGSNERMQEFVDDYLPSLVKSKAGQEMIEGWQRDNYITELSEEGKREVMMQTVQMADEALRRMPIRKVFWGVKETAKLWHQLVYENVPADSWSYIQALLAMRYYLITELNGDATKDEEPADELNEPKVSYSAVHQTESPLVQELAPMFYNNIECAREFAEHIGQLDDDRQVPDVAQEYLDAGKLRAGDAGRHLYLLLRKYNIYKRCESTWDRHIIVHRHK